jgi:hypothetical protein
MVDDVQLHRMAQTTLKKRRPSGGATGKVYQVIIREVESCAAQRPTAITFSRLSSLR